VWCCAVRADPKIALLGAMQSLFETSMYTFVFLWTPALSPKGEHLDHGLIFSAFMMACMAGSTIAGRLLADPRRHQVSHYMKARLHLMRSVGFCLVLELCPRALFWSLSTSFYLCKNQHTQGRVYWFMQGFE